MWKDPIVEEIRQIRLEIEAECHHDFEEIFRQATLVQEKYAHKNQKVVDNSTEISHRIPTLRLNQPIDEATLRRIIREELCAVG
jgi:thiamine phosphate synthase YjbQ (UPF0047 family)